jgi:flagellar basal body-associated protein FliL
MKKRAGKGRKKHIIIAAAIILVIIAVVFSVMLVMKNKSGDSRYGMFDFKSLSAGAEGLSRISGAASANVFHDVELNPFRSAK